MRFRHRTIFKFLFASTLFVLSFFCKMALYNNIQIILNSGTYAYSVIKIATKSVTVEHCADADIKER